uniref:Uncharacterized protein n=1 Tax=Oncorhynchus mykiss TaxID=8022 RepID=A0A8K9WM80_ONCMY
MPIQSFSFPLPETRFFQAGQHVYKFKIRGVKVMGEEFVNRELEVGHCVIHPLFYPSIHSSFHPSIHSFIHPFMNELIYE